jgi:hypothetical protein
MRGKYSVEHWRQISVKHYMQTRFAVLLGFTFLATAAFSAFGETVQVSGRANPWLAGMTNGSTARRGDSAPDESPVPITATAIEGHATYTFSASGSVNHGFPLPFSAPDGEDLASHYLGAENGIADLAAPFASLIGVFLGPNQPDQNPAPEPLDFTSPASRDYLELAPALNQPFFIGDGLTSSRAVQQVIAPIGATRLFLGVMDGYRWSDNEGTFTVEITKADSAPAVQLSLHPSLRPTDADAVANPAKATAAPTTALTTSAAATGPELHAFTAIELVWPSETNHLYQVQWTPALDPLQWVNFGPVVSGSGGNVSVYDSTRTHPQGFYRVQIVL